MSERHFSASPTKEGEGIRIDLPFDPNEVWGAKERHYITGTVAGHQVRGLLKFESSGSFLTLGPAWLRDHPLSEAEVQVILRPEGPQETDMAPDIVAALDAEPEAKAFFKSLATFYRKGYVNWIESAKRPETRARRITEAIRLLNDHHRQR